VSDEVTGIAHWRSASQDADEHILGHWSVQMKWIQWVIATKVRNLEPSAFYNNQ
jgi:hypothetical protein